MILGGSESMHIQNFFFMFKCDDSLLHVLEYILGMTAAIMVQMNKHVFQQPYVTIWCG